MKQEMPSRQQKSTKGPERYLMSGLDLILVTLRWDEERSPGHKYFCRRFFFKGTNAGSILSRYK